MSEEVKAQVTQCVWRVPAPYSLTDEKPVPEDEEAPHTHSSRGLKSGKVRTTDSLVVKKVKWPHKVAVTNQGQPPVYGEMSLSLFVNGYLTIFTEESAVTYAEPSSAVDGGF